MNNELYYYKGFISSDIDSVENYIAKNEIYNGEEGLLNIFENDIGIIDCFSDLQHWCYDYGYDMKDLLSEFGIDYGMFLRGNK